MRLPAKKTAPIALAIALALIGATLAQAGGLTKKGVVEVSFEGSLLPSTLPRSKPAPVSVQMNGAVKTTDRSAPPRLERISLDINRHGILSAAGLPGCPLAKISTGSGEEARAACGRSMIGHGNVTTRVELPGQEPFDSVGGMLAFNGTYHGRPAIFAQVASGPPLALTYVIVFEVKKTHGTFGTSLTATLPPIASGYGSVSSFYLTLSRTFTHNGQKRSYVSAACPAPAGFPGAPFTLAKATYEFQGGLKMSNELTKQCKVRG